MNLLQYRKLPLIERLGFFVLTLRVIQQSEIIEALRHVEMIQAESLLS
jgi:hypothetical protein